MDKFDTATFIKFSDLKYNPELVDKKGHVTAAGWSGHMYVQYVHPLWGYQATRSRNKVGNSHRSRPREYTMRAPAL